MGFLRCCVYYGILAVVSFFIGRLLPKSWFHGDKFPYRCASWEAKLFRFLRVHEWQDKVPDMSKIVPKLIPAKKLGTDFRAQLPRMIEETCVAEFTHFVLMLLGFYALRLWPGTGGAVVTAIYILFGNLPFLIIQRYNRPRLQKLLAAQQRRLGLGFVAGHQRHGDARAGLGKAQRLARQAAAVLLHHGDRNTLHHFVGVEPGVEKAVEHGRADQQQQHADIAGGRAQRVDQAANEGGWARHDQRAPHLSGRRRPRARPAVASSNSTSVASAREHTMGRLCTTGAPIWNCSICSRA